MFLNPFLVALRKELLEDLHRDGEVEVGVLLDGLKRHSEFDGRDESVGEDAAVAGEDVMPEKNREEHPDLFGENCAAIHSFA